MWFRKYIASKNQSIKWSELARKMKVVRLQKKKKNTAANNNYDDDEKKTVLAPIVVCRVAKKIRPISGVNYGKYVKIRLRLEPTWRCNMHMVCMCLRVLKCLLHTCPFTTLCWPEPNGKVNFHFLSLLRFFSTP